MSNIKEKYINEYLGTNENPYLIMDALSPSKEDNILSICSGGTVPFGFVEKGASVNAVDFKLTQLNYVRERGDALRRGNIDNFLQKVIYDNCFYNNKFMKEINHWDVLDNLEKLTLNLENIFNLDKYDYNKIYLSNAGDTWNFNEHMDSFGKKLNKGTLVYFTSFNVSPNDVAELREFKSIKSSRDFGNRDVRNRWGCFLIEKK